MEPRIQYAQTKDGVSIAYWTLGEGAPFVMIPVLPFSHVQLEWKMPAYARWYQHHARERQLVRYDPRGVGLSQRDVSDFSIEAQLQDLSAVVDRLDLPPFALWAYGRNAGPIGVTFAARFPERVTRLILFSPTLSVTPLSEVSVLESMREEDWGLYLKTASHVVMGWPRGDLARELGTIMAESVTPKTAAAVADALKDLDITLLLSKVLAPTLVIARRQAPVPLDIVTSVAARLPNARLVVLEGDSMAFVDDPEVVTAIDEFLSEGQGAAAKPELPEGMAVILFADIVESTALTEQLGDTAFRAKARELDGALRGIIGECAGTPVEGKVLGDGVLAVFTSARQAIDCALRCNGAGESVGLQLHLGIHAGDVIREGNNVYGGAVNIAARIAGASAPGEVLVSDTVRGLARTSAGVSFEDRGEHTLKGIDEPQRLFAVRGGG